MKRILFLIAFFAAILATPSAPIVERAQGQALQSQGNPKVKVWVNTASGVYHCPVTRWYGNTKHGEYMSQKEALAKGNRPSYGTFCE